MNQKDIEKFVEKFMASQEPDTFVKNEHGQYMYTAARTTLNLKTYFEDIIEAFIEEREQIDYPVYRWISAKDRLPNPDPESDTLFAGKWYVPSQFVSGMDEICYVEILVASDGRLTIDAVEYSKETLPKNLFWLEQINTIEHED